MYVLIIFAEKYAVGIVGGIEPFCLDRDNVIFWTLSFRISSYAHSLYTQDYEGRLVPHAAVEELSSGVHYT
jgi:hypothetical protein